MIRCFQPFPLVVGNIGLPNRVVLAPMTGITDAPFRRMAARLGSGLVVSEMTASRDLAEGRPEADLNHDCTVDLREFGIFQESLIGP